MFPLGLVTMLFLVLFVWGCAGKERRGEGRRGRRHNKSVNNSKTSACERVSMHVYLHTCVRALLFSQKPKDMSINNSNIIIIIIA